MILNTTIIPTPTAFVSPQASIIIVIEYFNLNNQVFSRFLLGDSQIQDRNICLI